MGYTRVWYMREVRSWVPSILRVFVFFISILRHLSVKHQHVREYPPHIDPHLDPSRQDRPPKHRPLPVRAVSHHHVPDRDVPQDLRFRVRRGEERGEGHVRKVQCRDDDRVRLSCEVERQEMRQRRLRRSWYGGDFAGEG